MQNELSGLSEKSETNSTKESETKGQALSLDAPGVANKIAQRVATEIDSYCVRTYDGGHRTHLGASLIGRSCKRYLWYVFRWCKRAPTTGRKQRLFNRGHREEARFIEWLEGVGFKVWFEDRNAQPDENGNYPQYRISDCDGHFGGSLDGIAQFPPGWGIDEPVLLEFKTHGTGQGFNKLKDNKMPVEKKDHYAQTSTYGVKYKFRYVLYLSINKNDDDLHVELAQLNWTLGEQMIKKASEIIFTLQPPPKLSESPTYFECKYCDMLDICHEGAVVDRNCRSCVNARPVENGGWWCELHSPEANDCIPKDVIPVGCPSYKAIA